MSTIEERIEVDVPVRVAYDQWTQFEQFPRFMEGVHEVRQLDDAHLHWRADVAGTTHEWDAEITQQVPDRIIAWTATQGYRNAGTVNFQPLADGRTEIHLILDHDPEGAVEKMGDWLGMAKRRAKGDLERFREMIESRGAPTGAWRGEMKGGAPAGDMGTQGTLAEAGAMGSMGGMGTVGAMGTTEPLGEGMPPEGSHGSGKGIGREDDLSASTTERGTMMGTDRMDMDRDRDLSLDRDPALDRDLSLDRDPALDRDRTLDRDRLGEDLTDGPTPETRDADYGRDRLSHESPEARGEDDLTDGPTPETREVMRETDADTDRRDRI